MPVIPGLTLRSSIGVPALGLLLAAAVTAAPIIQPGAPGEPARELTAEEAVDIADTSYSPADVRFMQDMIPHHHQALEMAELVADRTNNRELIDVAGRIEATQGDEIAFMQSWLRERGERVPDPTAHHAMHMHHEMAGMATPEQMAELAAAEGREFDRLFLTLMITHHEGAIVMVEELLEESGSAYDPVLFEFTADVTNDQAAEIQRMNVLLTGLSTDPRAGLAAGLGDAGEAILNLELVAALPRPPGFFDPANPGERGVAAPKDEEGGAAATEDAGDDPIDEDLIDEDEEKRYPMLSFSNTDMAFAGDVLVAGSYHGFNVYRLGQGGVPSLVSSVVCPGGQGDVSIVGDLLLMSVEETRGRLDCGLGGVAEDASPERFRGIRIFDISDLGRPLQVGAVQTCRGSHTHSVVSGPGEDGTGADGKIIVYNSGTSTVREEDELPGCIDESPGDERTALFRIDVIEIPVDDPGRARIVDSPAVFADPESGALAGLWRGGQHDDEAYAEEGERTQETSPTDECHDITVFPDLGIAAGACSGNGILFDVSDPRKPERIDAVADKGFAYWHSATFNNDGTKVIFTDEWGGGARARCRARDPLTWGADALYDIVGGELEFRGYYKIPAPQDEMENCVAHNGSIVPVPGRDLFVQAWYQGGISVIDFTDTASPVEIAYFDRGPIDDEELIIGGYWSAYWYDGRIYATEIVRGLDVFALTPSEYLSEAEIAAAALADRDAVFNPQQQFRVTWPDHPLVAQAYLDQLQRAGTVPAALAGELAALLEEVQARIEAGERDVSLATRLGKPGRELGDSPRETALKETLQGIVDRLTKR